MSAGPKVLVLEDEPMILMDLVFAFEDEGATPLEASGVDDALAIIDKDRPDVAVLDVNLGHNTTCEAVAKQLEALGIPFLLHSGDLDRQGELLSNINAEVVPKPAPSGVVAKRVLGLVG